jgi:lysophospholipase
VLRAMAEGLIAPDAAVLVAPMLGLNGGPIPGWLGLAFAQIMTRIGDPARRAWKQSERPLDPAGMRQTLLTHCPDRYADELWWRAETPDVALGPPSWAWVAEAYRSMRALERSDRIETMRTPILILAARADRLVSPAAIRRIAARLPDAVLHVYGPEASHEILREADAVRLDALARIDGFLDRRVLAAA